MTSSVSKKGEFEACFADGLDLSDFTTTVDLAVPVRSSSHAASLLRIKQAESIQKYKNETEESKVQDLIRDRAEALKLATKATNEEILLRASPPLPTSRLRGQCASSLGLTDSIASKRTNGLINAVVVAMHTAEGKEEPKQKLSKLLNKAYTRKKPKATKKSTRTKY